MFLKDVLFSQIVTDGDHVIILLIKPYHELLIVNQIMIKTSSKTLKEL